MTNYFAAHGIEHLSPSSCNTFAASPAMFILTKVLKKPTSVGAAAHRGSSVESGVTHGLMNPSASLAECVEVARDSFARLTALSGDSRLDKEKDAIAPFVEQGLLCLRPYGQPVAVQTRIDLAVEGLAVPIMGYLDFEFAGGVIVDLKTTHAVPSKISTSHARQVALYASARGDKATGRLAYVSTKKSAVYELENIPEHLKALSQIGLAIQKFLSISDDPQELASLIMPDVDSFYFSDPITRQAAFEVWGV
jgi:hypothetical protein